jgi:hypothetical protein
MTDCDVVLVEATKNATRDSRYWFSWLGCLQLLESMNRLSWEAVDFNTHFVSNRVLK